MVCGHGHCVRFKFFTGCDPRMAVPSLLWRRLSSRRVPLAHTVTGMWSARPTAVAWLLRRGSGQRRRASTIAPPPLLSLSALRELVRQGDVEGHLCGSFMPTAARESFYAVRALNIEVASVRDATRGNVAAARLRLGFWRSVVDS